MPINDNADQVWLSLLLVGRFRTAPKFFCQRFIINGWSKLSKSHRLISIDFTNNVPYESVSKQLVSLSSNTRRTRVRILANHAPRYRVPWCPFFSFPTPIFKNGSPKPWAWDPREVSAVRSMLAGFPFWFKRHLEHKGVLLHMVWIWFKYG